MRRTQNLLNSKIKSIVELMIIDAVCSDLSFRKTVIRAHQSSSRVFTRVYYAMASFFTCLVICSGALPMASALIADPDIRIARLNKPNSKIENVTN